MNTPRTKEASIPNLAGAANENRTRASFRGFTRPSVSLPSRLEQKLGFTLPTSRQVVSAYADFEQHLHRTKDAGVCASCGVEGGKKQRGVPEGLNKIEGQLVPVGYFLCEACR